MKILCDDDLLAKLAFALENGPMQVHYDSPGCDCAACRLDTPLARETLRGIYDGHWPNNTACDCVYCIDKNYPPSRGVVRPTHFPRHPSLLEVSDRQREIDAWEQAGRPGPSPEPLHVVPFSAGENHYFINTQEKEPFRAIGTCPGCGNIEAHLLRTPGYGEPEWAAVIRSCSMCHREWAQK
jgi:hypothetical protein